MKKILLLGAGNIGAAIAELLAASKDYQVTVADKNQSSLDKLPTYPNINPLTLDVTSATDLQAAMDGKFAVVNACPFHITKYVAEVAVASRVHYFDLMEDVAGTKLVKSLAKKADTALLPQCGVAPGFITIAAYELIKQFDTLNNVHLRVGALPEYPSNALKYNLTWSTDGLINEYCNPCEAIVDGVLTQVPALEEVESFSLDGITYEAFNTSGGLGTLCDTLAGKVDNLNYRSVRYPGHRDIMKVLLKELRLRDRRHLLKEILETSIPFTYQDLVLVFVSVSGIKNGQFVQQSYAKKIYSQSIYNKLWSAIQITTAAGICAVLDLLVEGKLPQQGFIRQEDVPYNDFINNRFGRYYAE